MDCITQPLFIRNLKRIFTQYASACLRSSLSAKDDKVTARGKKMAGRGVSVRFWGKWLRPLCYQQGGRGFDTDDKLNCAGLFNNRGGIVAWVWSHVNGVLLPWFGLAVCEGELLAYEFVYYVVLDFYLLLFKVAELLELFGGG